MKRKDPVAKKIGSGDVRFPTAKISADLIKNNGTMELRAANHE